MFSTSLSSVFNQKMTSEENSFKAIETSQEKSIEVMFNVFNLRRLFKSVMNEVDAIGYNSHFHRCMRYSEKYEKALTDIYYNNPYRDYKAMASSCKELRNIFLKQMDLDKHPTILDRKDLETLGNVYMSCYKNGYSNFVEILSTSNVVFEQRDSTPLSGNINIFKELIKTQSAYKSCFILKHLVDEIPEFFPMPFMQTNYINEHEIIAEIIDDTAFRRMMTSSERVAKYNLQLIVDCFNPGQLKKIKELSNYIRNNNSYQGVVYSCYNTHPLYAFELMQKKEFFLPIYIKGSTNAHHFIKKNLLNGENDSKGNYNFILKIDTQGAKGALAFKDNKCIIDSYSKYRYIDAEQTPFGLVISLKLLAEDHEINFNETLNHQWAIRKGALNRVKNQDITNLFKLVKNLCGRAKVYGLNIPPISDKVMGAYKEVCTTFTLFKNENTLVDDIKNIILEKYISLVREETV